MLSVISKNCKSNFREFFTRLSIKKLIFLLFLFFSAFSFVGAESISGKMILGTTYKIISLLIGVIFMYFGYRLFKFGITEKSGDVNVQVKYAKFIVEKAAPGTIFTICGAAIVIAAIIKGITIS